MARRLKRTHTRRKTAKKSGAKPVAAERRFEADAIPISLRQALAPHRNGIASTRNTVGLLSDEAAQTLARRCRDAAIGKKAEDVVMLDIRNRANFADYFVLATGRSLIQARAIADAVVEACEDDYGSPVRTEGYNEGGWILVDYGPVIVHVFLPQSREFYNLERLWGPRQTARRPS